MRAVRVTVVRRGELARNGRTGPETLELSRGSVAGDVPSACGIDPRACVVVVNGVAVSRTTRLFEGDRAQLYPAQAGG